MGALNLASCGLFLGAMGQAAFFESLFPRLHSVVFCLLLPPWLTVYTISFCRQPPCGPRTFRYALMLAMCWYAVAGLLAESLSVLLHAEPAGHISFVVARGIMYLGALSFIPFVRFCLALRRYEAAR